MDPLAFAQIASLYDSHLLRYYARAKLASDPAYAATAGVIAGTPLPLLDIGCGLGLLGQYLHAAGHASAYVGLDHDTRKVAAAQRAIKRAGLCASMDIRHADAAEAPPMQGHVVLLDVLHYLTIDRQRALLQLARRHLAHEGSLIIRNVLREPNWRFRITRLQELFLHASGWIPGGVKHYPTAGELRELLEDAGLDVRMESLHGRTPFNSYLIVARPRY